MTSNLARKRSALAQSDAIIAVSQRLATDLLARAPELAGEAAPRMEVIPNPVDIQAVSAAKDLGRPMDAPPSPFAVYVGKLAPNKGVARLLELVEIARLTWPVVVIGDGPERQRLQESTRGRGLDFRFLGWLDRQEAWQWMAHASLLLFPSAGPESLSRVLLEAAALAMPIAALDTGGTSEIVIHNRTGLLAADIPTLGEHVRQLADDPALGRILGAGACELVAARFQTDQVVARVERLYEELLSDHRGSVEQRAFGAG